MASVEVAPTAQFKPVPAVIPPNQREGRLALVGAVLLSLAVFALYLIPTAITPGRPSREQNKEIANTSISMVQNQSYLVPVTQDKKPLAAPPLPYWLAAGVYTLAPMMPKQTATLQSTYLPAALLGSLSIFVLMLFAAQMWNRAASVWCGLFLGLSIGYMRFSQLGMAEIESVFFYLGALLSAAWIVASPRAGISTIISLGICAGFTILGGSPLGVFLVVLAAMCEAFFQKGLTGRKIGFLVGGLVLAILTIAPWANGVASAWTGPESWSSAYLQASVLTPYGTANYLRHNVLTELLPWTPLLLVGWVGLSKRMRSEKALVGADELKWMLARYLLAASILSLPIIVAAPWRPANLLLFIVPFAAASGYMVSRLDQPGGVLEEKIAWLQLFWTLGLGLAVIVAPLWVPQFIGSLPERFTLQLWIVSGCVGLGLLMLSFTGSRQFVEARTEIAGLHFGVVGMLFLSVITVFVAARYLDESAGSGPGAPIVGKQMTITPLPVPPPTPVPAPAPVAPAPAAPTPAQ